jgi:hypothetical protein
MEQRQGRQFVGEMGVKARHCQALFSCFISKLCVRPCWLPPLRVEKFRSATSYYYPDPLFGEHDCQTPSRLFQIHTSCKRVPLSTSLLSSVHVLVFFRFCGALCIFLLDCQHADGCAYCSTSSENQHAFSSCFHLPFSLSGPSIISLSAI